MDLASWSHCEEILCGTRESWRLMSIHSARAVKHNPLLVMLIPMPMFTIMYLEIVINFITLSELQIRPQQDLQHRQVLIFMVTGVFLPTSSFINISLKVVMPVKINMYIPSSLEV